MQISQMLEAQLVSSIYSCGHGEVYRLEELNPASIGKTLEYCIIELKPFGVAVFAAVGRRDQDQWSILLALCSGDNKRLTVKDDRYFKLAVHSDQQACEAFNLITVFMANGCCYPPDDRAWWERFLKAISDSVCGR